MEHMLSMVAELLLCDKLVEFKPAVFPVLFANIPLIFTFKLGVPTEASLTVKPSFVM